MLNCLLDSTMAQQPAVGPDLLWHQLLRAPTARCLRTQRMIRQTRDRVSTYQGIVSWMLVAERRPPPRLYGIRLYSYATAELWHFYALCQVRTMNM